MAITCHVVALTLGLAVLGRFGRYFRHHLSVKSEARYLTVALSTAGNIFLGLALGLYLYNGLATYLPVKLELVFSFGHLFTAVTPIVWHGLTYAELMREGVSCGNG